MSRGVIKTGSREIGKDKPVFIIAEAGVNHVLEQEDMKRVGAKSSLEVAYRMVDAAKQAGADAIKFQSFAAKGLQYKGTKKPQYQVENVGSDEEMSYFDMLKKLETSESDQIKIADYCKKKGIMFLSTPYDTESADFLEKKIRVPMYKLASIELNNHLFIRYAAGKGKPVILSTGLGSMDDVKAVVGIARKEGFAKRLVLLQCTADYPAKPNEINLNVLKTYMEKFPDILFGFSDHSPTDTASIGAVAIGAAVLEKHFTLDRSFRGPDHSASLDINGLKKWVAKVREIEESMGSYDKSVTESEKRNLSMRKYLVMTPQKAGTVIKENMLKAMRTGKGILPVDKNLRKIIGKKLKRDIKEITPLGWDMIK